MAWDCVIIHNKQQVLMLCAKAEILSGLLASRSVSQYQTDSNNNYYYNENSNV